MVEHKGRANQSGSQRDDLSDCSCDFGPSINPKDFNFLLATEVAPFILTHITVPFFMRHQCVSSIPKPALSTEAEQYALHNHPSHYLLRGILLSARRI